MNVLVKAAVYALRWVLPRADADAIAGDLKEEQARSGRSSAWLAYQLCRVCGRYIRDQWFRASPVRGDGFLKTLGYDLRFAVRSLLLNKPFTVLAFSTIVLTVGGITTVFTLVYSVLLTPLPYPEADRLVVLRQSEQGASATLRNVSFADAADLRTQLSTIEGIGLYQQSLRTLGPPDALFRARVWTVTADLFPLLGVRTVLGRGLLEEDGKPGNARVAVIDYAYWRSQYGGSPEALGQSIRLANNVAARIVGVVAPDFRMFVTGDPLLAVWTALQPETAELERRNRRFSAIARLRTGVSIEAVNAELLSVSKQLELAYPDSNRGRTSDVTPLMDDLVGGVRRTLWVFLGAVACVLMIGLANLVNLQIVRNSRRQREIGIRVALGAGRWRLVRQLLLETMALSLAAGLIGVAAAWAGIRVVILALPAGFPRGTEIQLDVVVVAFAMLVSTSAAIVFGLLPALRSTGRDLRRFVSETSRSTMTARRSQLQRYLITFETAIALVLLISAGLLTKSFYRLITADAGMNENRLRTATLTLPLAYSPAQTADFIRKTLEAVRLQPGIEAAAVKTFGPPLSGLGARVTANIERNNTRQQVVINNIYVSGEYFKTLGVLLLKGRPIEDSDIAGSERVMVINETMAEALWPGQDPIGKVTGGEVRVVGLVSDFQSGRLNEEVMAQMYQSYLQSQIALAAPTLMVRLSLETAAVAPALLGITANLDPNAKVDFATMGEVRWRSLGTERFRTVILMLFAFGAAFLALVGIWGVVSYSVIQRHREIGVRMALGATLRDVTGLMAREAIIPIGIGFIIGLTAAIGLTRLLQSLLFGVETTDPLTFVVAILILGGAGVLASLIPARRAMRVDPMRALRSD